MTGKAPRELCRVAALALAACLLGAAALGACSRMPDRSPQPFDLFIDLPWQDHDWYGYFYENVMVNAAPATSRPFASAATCLVAMRNYGRKASRWSGFACARDCRQQPNGVLTDCSEVVR